MRRVAFTLIGGGKGTGGYNYLLNLVRVLCLHESKRVTSVLLVGTDVPDDVLEPFRAERHAEIVQTPAMNESRKSAALASAIVFGADSKMRNLLAELRIDVVFESAQFFGWRIGLPTIAWIPDFQHRRLPHMFTRFGYWKREIGFRAEIAAHRTFMLSSEDARRDCEDFYPSTAGRTRAIPFAVPPSDPDLLPEARAVADGYGLPSRFFFMPNQLSKHKNHLLVLDALALLRSRNADVVIVSSGKQADERHPDHFSSVLAKVESLGLQQQFRMLGLIPYAHLLALMQASDALLNPSLFEGWSTPVEEARGLGVPLLLSDLDVHREQAADDATYFDRHSAEALANALEQFQPPGTDERAARAAKGRASASERVRRFAAEFALLVTDCAAGRAAQ